ncbi:hypothetical protein IV203_014520 [Nitzschia inconspicua]|uniref:Uncharacterized protein n=1 Tax=Nitzschia inconspicua TaxID=303405 RepID=A0A9K3LAI3_9STRA|nr:hypothetical protein IV203_014520 [Nitzschia inconspicua]
MIARMATTFGPLSESDIAEARTLIDDFYDDNRPDPENILTRNESKMRPGGTVAQVTEERLVQQIANPVLNLETMNPCRRSSRSL